jgi:hypothetical protein
MSNTQIRELLAKLQDEIQKTELDDDTRALVRDLDTDIHDLLDSEGQRAETDSVLEKPGRWRQALRRNIRPLNVSFAKS